VLTPHTPINSPPLPGLAHWTDSNGLSAGVQSRLDPCLQRTNERLNELVHLIFNVFFCINCSLYCIYVTDMSEGYH